MGSFEFRNKRMHYEERGDGSARVAILLHGNMSNHKRWLPLMDLLKKDYTCYALDFPGNGFSEEIDRYHSLHLLAECVDALIAHVRAERFVLFGHSMGGGVAQLTALKHRERIEALVLINSISFKGFHDFYRQKEYIASMHRNKTLLRELFEQSLPSHPDRAAIEEMVEDASCASARVFTDEPKAMSEFNLEGEIHALTMPTLIVRSDGDQIVSGEDALHLHAAIPNSTYVPVKSSSHSPHFEDPAALYDIIRNFNSRIRRTP